jgi:hypothetical protein
MGPEILKSRLCPTLCRAIKLPVSRVAPQCRQLSLPIWLLTTECKRNCLINKLPPYSRVPRAFRVLFCQDSPSSRRLQFCNFGCRELAKVSYPNVCSSVTDSCLRYLQTPKPLFTTQFSIPLWELMFNLSRTFANKSIFVNNKRWLTRIPVFSEKHWVKIWKPTV